MTSKHLVVFRRVWAHLTRLRKVQFYFLFCLSALSALAEMIGLGIVFPFLGAIVAPDKIMAVPLIAQILSFLNVNSKEGMLFFLTITLIAATFVAGAIKMLLLWAAARVSIMTAGDLSVELYRRTLMQPYIKHISQNSSEIISGIGMKVNYAIQLIHQSTTLISSVIILLALTSMLILVDPIAAVISAASFGSAYLFISYLVKKKLSIHGKVLSVEGPKTIKALQEGLGGIREVLLGGTQSYYLNMFAAADKRIRIAQAGISFVNVAPRPLMESFGITFIALAAYGFTIVGEAGSNLLPILGTLAVGAQRILPTLQAIYVSWASIVSSEESVLDALKLLDQPVENLNTIDVSCPLIFGNSVRLDSVSFSYQNDQELVLKNINLQINKGEHVGIIGTTGAGKSTMLDVFMGLLRPTEGRLLVDGKPVDEGNCGKWHAMVSHVPQDVFLFDVTIAENIALGEDLEHIDFSRLQEAAVKARIADFIESQSGNYYSAVGERGVKLSGGQKQRLAIARALYKKSEILVLDEATSALDSETEREVIDGLKKFNPELTVLMVAHRVGTLSECDRVLRVEQGGVLEVNKCEL